MPTSTINYLLKSEGPIALSFQLCYVCYATLQSKNSMRINPVAIKNTGNKCDNPMAIWAN